ncbi:MAG: hypothetical protein GX556_10955 [Fibrobacter sp.]|nr:hypothetical protein [Fibrobacter sp.]
MNLVKILTITIMTLLVCCCMFAGGIKSNQTEIEDDPGLITPITLDSICQSNILEELQDKYKEEYVILKCDSTSKKYGRIVLVEGKKEYEFWKNKLRFGGGLLLILGNDCEIDTTIPQY